MSLISNEQTLEAYDADLFSHVRRNINCLKEKEMATRKHALSQLLNVFSKRQLPGSIFEEIAHMGLKEFLQCFSDKSQSCRQTSVSIIIEMLPRSSRISSFLPYIFSVLIDRTNCHDLEGIEKVPEKMRPPPGQKPKVIVKIVESCEEIRMLYCTLIRKILALLEHEGDQIRRHLDDLINICRALIMDPAPEVQKMACQTLQMICKSYKDLLLHYTEIMGRAVLLPLISKKSKIRIAGLKTLTAIFWCGLYKYNAFVFENLIGFRDPNSVPIKDFYEPSHNINYLATFITDSNSKVRLQFMKGLKVWICDLDDKYDHHGKLVPYLLSGLFDKDQEVQMVALSAIEEIGRQIETEREKDFRENKQFAIDAAWVWDGKLSHLPVTKPLQKRPSLGSRFFIRGHVRKFWTALYKQIKDINLDNRQRACNLAIYGCIYTENYLTQYLDNMIPNFLVGILPHEQEDVACCSKVQKMFFYIGRYCEQSAYLHIMKSALAGQLVQNEEFIKASLRALTQMVAGSLEAVPERTGLCHKKKQIIELLNMLSQVGVTEDIYAFNAEEIQNFALQILTGLELKAKEEEIAEIVQESLITLVKLWSVGYYEQVYSQCLKIDVQQQESKNKSHSNAIGALQSFFNRVLKISSESSVLIQEYLGETYQNPPSLMDTDWKLTVVLNNFFLIKSQKFDTVLFSLTQQIISESLSFNRSIQILNFSFKYICHLFQENLQAENSCLQELSALLERSFANLLKFNPQKKVPVYDQKDQSSQFDPKILTVKEETFLTLFRNGSQSLRQFYQKRVHLKGKKLGELLRNYIPLTGKVRRSKDASMEGIKTVWMIFEREELNEQFPNEVLIHDENKEKIKVIPLVIDFAIEKLETLTEPEHNKVAMLFSILQNVLKCFPHFKTAATPLPLIYPEYSELFSRLIKYAIDEKDVEVRQKYVEFLRKANKKMKPWFELELKMALESDKFLKGQFLKDNLNL